MAKPDFALMWSNFPDHVKYPTLDTLFSFIGGTLTKNIHEPGFGPNGNTCAVRISRALNYGALPISRKLVRSLEVSTMTGADKHLYMFRVRDMKKYLRNVLGVTPKSVSKDFGTAFGGERGIVAYDVEGWSDASGHVALWDGTNFREPSHDDFRFRKDDPTTKVREATTTKMILWRL